MHTYNIVHLASIGGSTVGLNAFHYTTSTTSEAGVALELDRLGAVLNPNSGKWVKSSAVIEIDKLN